MSSNISPSHAMKSPSSLSPSPKWKRPSGIMKIIRKRRSLSYNNPPPNSSGRNSDHLQKSPSHSPGGMKRRANPFQCSPRKRLKSADVITEKTNLQEFEDSDFQLFRLLNSEKKSTTSGQSYASIVCDEETNESKTSSNKTEKEEPISEGKWIFPVDWSLKMKMRFISDTSFSWCQSIRTLDEAAGISSSVRCKDVSKENTSNKVRFKKLCNYWQHPNIPWLKLYPRIVPDIRIGKVVPGLQDKTVEESLHNNWVSSFTSVFQLLKAKHCPYFYMCTHQFTVLVRAAGLGSSSINAIVTPTTKGIREALTNEGVEFTMPFKDKETTGSGQSRKSSVDDESNFEAVEDDLTPEVSQQTEKDEEDDDDMFTTDDGASSWLKEIGIDGKSFPELNSNRLKIQRDIHKQIDSRPESLVYVEGGNTQALFNYLLNCRSCIATTGVQAGIPPTLLSPVAFTGATLKSMQTRTSLVQQEGIAGKRNMLEVVGPILPNALYEFCELFTDCQGQYTVSLSTYEQSLPFNVPTTESSDVDFIESMGLCKATVEYLQQKQELSRSAVKELVCKDGLYFWSE